MFQKHTQIMRGSWLLRHTQASGLQQAQLREWVIKLLQQLAKGEVEGKGNKGKGNKGRQGKSEHGKGQGEGKAVDQKEYGVDDNPVHDAAVGKVCTGFARRATGCLGVPP